MSRRADRVDFMFVDQQRALGRSWATIARMVGVSEHDLRTVSDNSYTAPDVGEAARRAPKLASGREGRPVAWAEPNPVERRQTPPCSNQVAPTSPRPPPSPKPDLRPVRAIAQPSQPLKECTVVTPHPPRCAGQLTIAAAPSATMVAKALVAAARATGEDPRQVFDAGQLWGRRFRIPALIALRARFPGAQVAALGRMTGVLSNHSVQIDKARSTGWWPLVGDQAVEAAMSALEG